MPKPASLVFCSEQAEEFWTGKISEKVRKSGLTKQQQRQLLQNLVHESIVEIG